jgi:hypothetical protein
MALPSFTHLVAEAICFGIETELPLRGAVAVGEAILDSSAGVFLGMPLVEVVRVERTQRWIGASFGPSFTKPGFNDSFHLNTVLPYKSHYKDRASEHATGMTVDWPRRWRESRKSDLRPVLRGLDHHPEFAPYYAQTAEFILFSEENHDWFKRGRVPTSGAAPPSPRRARLMPSVAERSPRLPFSRHRLSPRASGRHLTQKLFS